MRVWAWALGWWFVGCVCARAQEGVLLRERAGLRPALCGALRIQLADLADVRCAPDAASEDLSDRLRQAAERVKADKARLGVLIERDPDPGRVRMYILSSQTDQAVIAIERIEDRSDPDVDRSLALKVRNAYEVMSLAEKAQPALAQAAVPLAAALAPPPVPIARSPEGAEAAQWFVALEAGGGLALGLAPRAASSFMLAFGSARARSRLELGLGARLYSRQSARVSAGRVSMVERGPLLSGRWLSRRGRFEVGLAAEAQLSVMAAEATASDGRRGQKTLLTPVFGAALDVRVRLFASAYLRFAPGVEWPAIQRRWEVQEVRALTQAPVRISLPLSLWFSLPVGPRAERIQP